MEETKVIVSDSRYRELLTYEKALQGSKGVLYSNYDRSTNSVFREYLSAEEGVQALMGEHSTEVVALETYIGELENELSQQGKHIPWYKKMLKGAIK